MNTGGSALALRKVFAAGIVLLAVLMFMSTLTPLCSKATPREGAWSKSKEVKALLHGAAVREVANDGSHLTFLVDQLGGGAELEDLVARRVPDAEVLDRGRDSLTISVPTTVVPELTRVISTLAKHGIEGKSFWSCVTKLDARTRYGYLEFTYEPFSINTTGMSDVGSSFWQVDQIESLLPEAIGHRHEEGSWDARVVQSYSFRVPLSTESRTYYQRFK